MNGICRDMYTVGTDMKSFWVSFVTRLWRYFVNVPHVFHRNIYTHSISRPRVLSVWLHQFCRFRWSLALVMAPSVHRSCGSSRHPASAAQPYPPTHCPPICPPASYKARSHRQHWKLQRRGSRGCQGLAAAGSLTCVVTLGNSCLRKVFDFLVLLQKTLQKLGGFPNSNSKASSQPLLPCMNQKDT